jgi:hypothetical protein
MVNVIEAHALYSCERAVRLFRFGCMLGTKAKMEFLG